MKSEVVQKIVILSGIGLSVSVTAAIARYILSKRKGSSVDNRNTTIEVRLELPRKFLGYVIGKHGATISAIREETCTWIKLRDQDDEVASVIIRGLPDNVEAASKKIKKLTSESPSNFTKDVHIPENAWAYVIGLNGDILRQISYESKAVLTMKFAPHEKSNSGFHVTVRGTREQLDHAISLIDERIAQGEVPRESKSVGIAGRSLLENVLPPLQNSLCQEELEVNSASGFAQVFVSAVQSPSHFWVQQCGPKAAQLDKLVSEMTDFYGDDGRRASLVMPSVLPGDFVAAYFDGDNDWYRALVISLEKLSDKAAATVLFVDFGDSAVVDLDLLCRLKPEYFALPMQAIKCCLDGVSPVGERWTVDAVKLFEKLTYMAQWTVLMAQPVDAKTSSDNSSKSDPVYIKLFDANGPKDIDIADELVKAGHATHIS